MRQLLSIIALSALLFPVPSSAQDRLDLSGTWKMDAARSQSSQGAHGGLPVRDATMVVTSSSNELRVETVRDGNQLRVTFPVSNSGVAKPVGTSSGTGVGSIMTWEGQQLVTSTPMQVNGMAMRVIEKRTLSADRREMTVETAINVEHGYEGNGINYSSPVLDIYVRAN